MTLLTFICEGLKLGLTGSALLAFVQENTGCTEEEFCNIYSLLIEAYLQ
jgi:hypothetical protein